MADILVVDDDELMIELISDPLLDEGHKVRTALGGQEALDEIERERPDIVILDMNMPVIDGYTVARRLRAEPVTLSLPIVAVTGHDTMADRDAAIQAGCDAFITKPVDSDRLVDRVNTLISRQ
ncbi:MAG: response regulator [Rhodospirillaceae bacterium]